MGAALDGADPHRARRRGRQPVGEVSEVVHCVGPPVDPVVLRRALRRQRVVAQLLRLARGHADEMMQDTGEVRAAELAGAVGFVSQRAAAVGLPKDQMGSALVGRFHGHPQ